MNSLMFSLQCVLPIFAIMVVGYYIHKKNIVSQEGFRSMNALAFRVGLPLLLFQDVSNSDFQAAMDIRLISFAVLSTVIIFFGTWLIAEKFVRPKESMSAFVQGAFRSNYIVIGLSILKNVLPAGEEAAKTALVGAFIVPIYNILAIIILSLRSKNQNQRLNFKNILLNIFKNPLIIGTLIGLLFSILQIEQPVMFKQSVGYLTGMATPIALLSIGGSLEIREAKSKLKLAAFATTLKLVVTPLIFVPLAYWFGIEGLDLLILFVLFAAPTAVTSYIMASAMGGDGALAASIVVLTTLFSIVTMTIGIFILKALQMI